MEMTTETFYCSLCKTEIKKGEFIATIGKRANLLKAALRFGGLTPSGSWPMMDNPRVYCKSCFDKTFKSK